MIHDRQIVDGKIPDDVHVVTETDQGSLLSNYSRRTAPKASVSMSSRILRTAPV